MCLDTCLLLSFQYLTPFLPAHRLLFPRSAHGNVVSTDVYLSSHGEGTRSLFPEAWGSREACGPNPSPRPLSENPRIILTTGKHLDLCMCMYAPECDLQQGPWFLPSVQAHPWPQLYLELLSAFSQITCFWNLLKSRELASISCTQDAAWSRTVCWVRDGSCNPIASPSHHQPGLVSQQTRHVLSVPKVFLWDWYFKDNSAPSSCGLESG